jgi:hypothetical protein
MWEKFKRQSRSFLDSLFLQEPSSSTWKTSPRYCHICQSFGVTEPAVWYLPPLKKGEPFDVCQVCKELLQTIIEI